MAQEYKLVCDTLWAAINVIFLYFFDASTILEAVYQQSAPCIIYTHVQSLANEHLDAISYRQKLSFIAIKQKYS